MHVIVNTRPDCAYTISSLAQHLSTHQLKPIFKLLKELCDMSKALYLMESATNVPHKGPFSMDILMLIGLAAKTQEDPPLAIVFS